MPPAPAGINDDVNDGIVLRVAVDLSEREPRVTAVLEWDGRLRSALPSHRLSDFRIEGDASESVRPSLARYFAKDLNTALESAPPGPVWLRLEQPAGYLAAVPWEGANLDFRTLLRLPDQMNVPHEVTSYQRVAVVVCATDDSRGAVVEHVRDFVAELYSLMPFVEMHVFADDFVCGGVQEGLKGSAVQVHRPRPSTGRSPRALSDEPFPVEYITDVLDGVAVQALHLVMPGGFDGARPALIAYGLNRTQAISYADDGDVKRLADSVGAPVISVSPAPGGDEAAARMVADSVGATRPGPTIFAALERNTTTYDLAAAHHAIAIERRSLIDALVKGPELFYYLQPEVFRPVPRSMPASHDTYVALGHSPWLGGIGIRAITEDLSYASSSPVDVPLWAAASLRYVESRRAEIDQQATASSGRDSAYLSGAASALDEIQTLITRTWANPA